MEKTALKQFEAANGILQQDDIFTYDAEDQKREQAGRPWKDDPHYFKKESFLANLVSGQDQCYCLDKNGYSCQVRR